MDHVALGVTLIDMCRAELPIALLKQARQRLARFVYPSGRRVLPIGTEFLFNDSYLWGLGLHVPGASHTELAEMTTDIVRAFRASSVSPDVGEGIVGRAYGRAIGLAILHGGDLRVVNVDARLARFLHPRALVEVETVDELEAQVGGYSLALFFGMATGVDDCLSPGGMWMYSEEEWAALFQ
jgi:hypothetical protein